MGNSFPVEQGTATIADLDALTDRFAACDALERRPIVHRAALDDARRFRSPAGYYYAEIDRDATPCVRGAGYTYCAYLQWSERIGRSVDRNGVRAEYERYAGWIPLLTTEQPITETGGGDAD